MDIKYETIYLRVAGVTYNKRQSILAKLRGDEAVRIQPEPDNPYDKFALAVQIAMADGSIAHAGYVQREAAARLAPLLDGEAIMVSIDKVTGGFELEDGSAANLGLVLRVSLPRVSNGAYANNDTEGDSYEYPEPF